jgi:hypothetical protein
MRIYKNITYNSDLPTIQALQALSKPGISVGDYKNAFYQIGSALGDLLNKKMDNNYGNTMLACASEDADWLASGVLDSISQKDVSLAVFWNERVTLSQKTKLEYSPIIKSYIEPIENCKTLILVKSIISTSCVVKFQLLHLINKINPEKILILAPVMYKNAQVGLIREFPDYINSKFQFLTFAIDTERSLSGEVIPGVGGMVYPKLGLGDIHEKNKYIPQLVLARLHNK